MLALFRATYGPLEFEKIIQDASRAMGLAENGSENRGKFVGDICFLAQYSEKLATRLAKMIKDADEKSSFPLVSLEQTANVIGLGEPEGKQ